MSKEAGRLKSEWVPPFQQSFSHMACRDSREHEAKPFYLCSTVSFRGLLQTNVNVNVNAVSVSPGYPSHVIIMGNTGMMAGLEGTFWRNKWENHHTTPSPPPPPFCHRHQFLPPIVWTLKGAIIPFPRRIQKTRSFNDASKWNKWKYKLFPSRGTFRERK